MKQRSLASQGVFEKYGRKSRRELFLDEMERIVPWFALESLVRPHYVKPGNGRQPVGLSIMLRTYFVQQWFNLSDPGAEELLYESAAVRNFVGVDLGIAPAPDETTILRFRHVLEKHELCGLMLEAVNIHLKARGIRIQTGTIVDATVIHAPCSTRNASAYATRRCTRPGRATSGISDSRRTSGLMRNRATFTRLRPARLTWRTCICCPICCMARSARYGATAAIKARPKPSAAPRRTPRI